MSSSCPNCKKNGITKVAPIFSLTGKIKCNECNAKIRIHQFAVWNISISVLFIAIGFALYQFTNMTYLSTGLIIVCAIVAGIVYRKNMSFR